MWFQASIFNKFKYKKGCFNCQSNNQNLTIWNLNKVIIMFTGFVLRFNQVLFNSEHVQN